MADATVHPHPAPLLTRLLLVPLVVVILLAGMWLFAGAIAPNYLTSIIFGFGWFLLAAVIFGKLIKGRPELKWPVRGTFLVTSAVVAVWFGWTSFRNVRVDEQLPVVTPTPVAAPAPAPAPAPTKAAPPKPAPPPPRNVQLASAKWDSLAEGDASGTVSVVKLASGKLVLVLKDLDVNNGPDLKVYLAAGNPSGEGSVSDFVNLGDLKGNQGNQVYDIPAGTDVRKYSTALIYCKMFSVGFARARLAG